MQRNDDLFRELMFEAEAATDWRILEAGARVLSPTPEQSQREYHLLLLTDAGFVTTVSSGTYRLTNAGHEWLDTVRDETVWNKTKEAAGKVGGASLGLLAAIATGYAKERLRALGIPVE